MFFTESVLSENELNIIVTNSNLQVIKFNLELTKPITRKRHSRGDKNCGLPLKKKKLSKRIILTLVL